MGRVKNLDTFLAVLDKLPKALIARPTEILEFVKNRHLAGSGIGYVDAHLAASTALTPGARLWTRDKKLRAAAERLSIAADLD